MALNALIVIIIITGLISYNAFSNLDLKNRWMYVPYNCKHHNEYYRLFSHLFIHADFSHLLFNMISLYFLGNFLIQHLMFHYGVIGGQVHFVILYFLGGLFATLIPYFRNQDNSSYMALGASGAVSAVIFGAIMWDPFMNLRLMFIPIDIPAIVFGPLYIAYEIYSDRRGNTGIAHDAHIGGAIFGVVYILIINVSKAGEFVESAKLFFDRIF